jgi:hypothetical protein
MGDFIGLSVIVVLALSPLLRRFYIDRFWIHGRGTVIRVDLVIGDNERVRGSGRRLLNTGRLGNNLAPEFSPSGIVLTPKNIR